MSEAIVNQMFSVPNTPQGRLFIELVKEYKEPCYKVVCKGRTLNKKKCQNNKITKREIRSRQTYGNYPISLSVGAKTVIEQNRFYQKYYSAQSRLNLIFKIFESFQKAMEGEKCIS